MNNIIENKPKENILGLFLKFSIGSWGAAALSFFTTPIVTALILPNEFGKASMFVLAFNLLMQIVLLGTDQSFGRMFYQKEFVSKQHKLLVSSIILPLILSVIVSAGILLFWERISYLLIEKPDFKICLLLCLTIVFGVFERFALLVIRMQKNGIQFSLIRLFASFVTFICILLYALFVSKDFYAII